MHTTLYLIRHGETDWNLEGRWQGHADVPLNGIGREQAKLLARRFYDDGLRFDAIYSSDLARALETAWEVGALMGTSVQIDASLREIDIGAWSGLTYREIKERFPDEIAKLHAGEDVARGGGETTAMLQERMSAAILAIAASHFGEQIAIVTHGGCIRSVLAYFENAGTNIFGRYEHIGNTSISVIELSREQQAAITVINDMQHLERKRDDLATAPPDDAEEPQPWNA